MMLVRLIALAVGLSCVLLGTRPAEACGSWSMVDKERTLAIRYLINSASITKAARRRAALYFEERPDGLRVVKDRKVVLEIRGDKILKRGKQVGRIEPTGAVVLGKHTFTIELSEPGTTHGMPSWRLSVRRGDTEIVEGTGVTALCAGGRDTPPPEAEQHAEIRQRVIYYLAWREVGTA